MAWPWCDRLQKEMVLEVIKVEREVVDARSKAMSVGEKEAVSILGGREDELGRFKQRLNRFRIS